MAAVQIKSFTPEDAENAKSWPFQEATRLIKRLERMDKTGPVIFETGYGPSGLPHIGTFQRSRARPWCAAPLNCSQAARPS